MDITTKATSKFYIHSFIHSALDLDPSFNIFTFHLIRPGHVCSFMTNKMTTFLIASFTLSDFALSFTGPS